MSICEVLLVIGMFMKAEVTFTERFSSSDVVGWRVLAWIRLELDEPTMMSHIYEWGDPAPSADGPVEFEI